MGLERLLGGGAKVQPTLLHLLRMQVLIPSIHVLRDPMPYRLSGHLDSHVPSLQDLELELYLPSQVRELSSSSERVLLCSAGWLATCHIADQDLELLI